ncbi:hypothetical protein R6Q59_013169 [Mikania micrantha]
MDTMSFYMCTYACDNFMLHEWCTRLPAELKGHPGHPQHTLLLLPKCLQGSLQRISLQLCRVCLIRFRDEETSLTCKLCAFHIHAECGFLFPETIRHNQSIHLGCAPLDPQRKTHINALCREDNSDYSKIKFGGIQSTKIHPHRLIKIMYVIECDEGCMICYKPFKEDVVLACLRCRFAIHSSCKIIMDHNA